MLSLHISSKIGTEIFKGEYQIIDDINGIPTLETDYSKTKHNHAEPLFMMSNAYTDKFVMIIKEQSSKGESNKTRYTAVHSFIYDFSLDRLYDTYTQYFSLENILGLLFSDTDYDFEVKADQTYYSLNFQNFGDNDKMNLLNQICERWELEYHITGKTVVLGQRRGQKTNKQFRYKMNITDSSVDLDISEGATYIRATFGSEEKGNLTEREMTHPLADRFGIKHAKPYSNENIELEETMQRYMQQKIEDTWKLSIKIDISDIEGSGDVEVGDTVWAIDERLDLSYNTRIIELKRYYNKNDEVYKTEAVLGNRAFADTINAEERTPQQEIEDIVTDYAKNKMLADLQAGFDNNFNAARDEYRRQLDAAIVAVENEVAAKDAAHRAFWEETDQKINNSIQKIVGGDINSLNTSILDIDDNIKSFELTAIERFQDMNASLLGKLGVGDLQPFENRLTANENGISALFSRLPENINLAYDSEKARSFDGTSTKNINHSTENYILSDYDSSKTLLISFDFILNSFDRPDLSPRIQLTAEGVNGTTFHDIHVSYSIGEIQNIVIEMPQKIDKFKIGRHRLTAYRSAVGDVSNVMAELKQTGQTEPSPYEPHLDEQEEVDLSAVYSRLDYNEEQLQLSFERLNEVGGEIFDLTTTASGLTSQFGTLEGNVGALEDWRMTKGSMFEQTAEGFRAKVWRDDIELGIENMIPDADFVAWESSTVPSHWKKNWGAGHTFSGRQNTKYLLVRANNETVNTSSTYGVHSPILTRDVIAGEEYTLVFNNFDFGNFPYDYMYLINEGGSVNQNLSVPEHDRFIDKWSDTNTSKNVERMVLRFVANFSGKARILWGKRIESGQNTSFYINEPMLVRGNVAPKSFSPAPADSLKQTDFVIQSDGFLLGTRKVGGDTFAAGIVGDSSGLKLLGDTIIDGNTYVRGKIESLSMAAVSANFGKVFANTAEIDFIQGKHLKFDNAMVQEFYTHQAFINNAEIKAANIRDLTASNIGGGILSSLNDNMKWNLNTGHFVADNAFFEFLKPDNAMAFQSPVNKGVAGVTFAHNLGSSANVMISLGTIPSGTNAKLIPNHKLFQGMQVREGISTSIVGNRLDIARHATGSGEDGIIRGFRFTVTDSLVSSKTTTNTQLAKVKETEFVRIGVEHMPFDEVHSTLVSTGTVRNLRGGGTTEILSNNGNFGLRVTNTAVQIKRNNGSWTNL